MTIVKKGGKSTYAVQYSSDLHYHFVLKKHSIARNNLGFDLFYVVNVLLYFKIA